MVRSWCVFKWVFMGMLTILCIKTKAQSIQPGPILFKKPIQASSLTLSGIDPANGAMKAAAVGNQVRVFLQFQTIPDSRKKQVLLARGIELLDYIPENVFLANVKGKWSAAALKEMGIIATIPFDNSFKHGYDNGNIYAKSNQGNTVSGKWHLVISPEYDSNQVRQMVSQILKDERLPGTEVVFLNRRLAEMQLTAQTLEKILARPFVLYAMPARNLVVLNSVATDNLTAQSVQQGGNGVPGLLGKGVVMGVGDEGRADHIDNGYNEEGQDYNSGYHSAHVAGTMIGAGIVNPYMKGFAPKSTLIVDFFNTIIYRAPDYYRQKRMVLTNNSYGAGSYCVPYSGEYSGYSGQVDQQLLDFPNMLHVFAAGNSGDLQCGNFPVGYRSIDNSFQAGKNVITVGGTSHDGLTNKFSKGPVNDGRIKPEISGIGNAMISTISGNGYGSNQGTSMSAPQVTGALALLYERYRQLNGDLDPPGDLAKAIICNTATDIGTKGVDFSTGFGWLNLQKAIEVVNDKTYKAGIVEQGQEQVFEVSLDKEVFDFKVMLYWHDQPSSYYTTKNLVNDLDLTVQLPDGSLYDPMVLDTSAAGVTKPAVMGKDHINNIEQVVIEHAFPGRYIVRIKGYKIPVGPQAFKIVYNWQEPGLRLLQPIGGEPWKPGELRGIHWQDAGHDEDAHNFDYSTDNGLSWTSMPGITGTYNRVDWTVPSVQTAAARIKITNNNTGNSFISNLFVILPEINYTINSSCSSEIAVQWSKPPGIDSVIVLLYQSVDFIPQTITADSSFTIKGLRSGPTYWITLQPLLQGKPGERSIAKQIITATGNCLPTGLAGDMDIRAILLPPTGREASSTAQPAPIPIKIQIANTGSTTMTDSIFLDLFKDGLLLGKDTLVKSFSGGEAYDWATKISLLPIPGTSAAIDAMIMAAGDTNLVNNRLDSSWRYLLNQPLVLPYQDSFSGLQDSTYGSPGIIGIPGADHWDFKAPSTAVSLFTHQKFTSHCKIEGQSIQLIGTFNLATYQLTDNIRAKLTIPSLDDLEPTIYVRGSDASPWLVLPVHDAITGIDDTRNMDISGTLEKGNQAFSSSFQVMISGVTGSYVQDLVLLSAFELFAVRSDLSLVAINNVQTNVTDGDSMQIELRAYNKQLTTNGAFTVGIKSPDGQVQTVLIDSIGANKTVSVPFTIKVTDWPRAEVQLLAWVSDTSDRYAEDDSLQATITYYRKINKYPYLEGFEHGEAGWNRSYIYRLSDQLTASVAPFKPANGKVFWGIQRVAYSFDIAYPVSAGYLASPLFDVSGLKQPWLSMSVNKQLCDGMDSVVMQFSLDTGITWKTLPWNLLTTNWYNEPARGSWKDCGNDYWQVVSTPLPVTGKGIMVRVLLRGAGSLADEFPRLPGGLLVDDIHVFDLAYPIYDEHQAVPSAQQVKENELIHYTNGDRVIAVSQSAGASAGNSLLLSKPEVQRNYQGNRVFPQSWVFKGREGGTADSRVRLYFTHQQAMEWLSAIPCDTCQQKRSAYDLAVYRYSGPDAVINETADDNTPGYSELWPAAAFDLVPYESGYYAEVPAAAYGEFYIGLDEKGSGLSFTAEKQPGANIVLLNWTVENSAGITRFEVERAARNDAAPAFERIGTVPASGNQLTYYSRDTRINPPGAWHYRLKVIYENGDIRYSALRTISFESAIEAIVYPNPSPDGKVSILLRNTEGKNVELSLYDQSGRYIWGQQVPAQAQQQIIMVSPAGGRLPTGVYALKIGTGTEKKTIQLVISRN